MLGYGYYSIRPLHRLDQVLYDDSANGYVAMSLKTITESESGLSMADQWIITYTDGNYLIKNRLNREYLYPMDGATTALNQVTTEAYNSSTDRSFFWNFIPVSPAPVALLLYDANLTACLTSSYETTVPTRSIGLGRTYTLAEIGFVLSVCYTDSTNHYVTWSSSNTSVATVNSSTGAVTPITSGETIITASRTINGTLYQVRFKLNVLQANVAVQVIYDQEYLRKYSNAQSRISGYMNELKEFYLRNVGLYVNFSTPTVFQSLADQCPNTPNSTCNCGDCYSSYVGPVGELIVYDYHHTNIDNILGHLPTNPNGKVIAFSGHDTCDKKPSPDNSHVYNSSGNGIYGVSLARTGCCVISTTTIPGITSARELQTAIHEFGHLFGAPDHHGINGAPSSESLGTSFSRNCIYGENKESLASPIICAGCKALIVEEINNTD